MRAERPLTSKVALVTGASRGVGRGIAHELGIAGATVYVTGRTRAGRGGTDGLPGTIDDAATLATDAGGVGVAVECDHLDDNAVGAVAERLRVEQGRLDVLINNVWGGYEQYDPALWTLPVWEQPIWRWDKMMSTGVRAHYTTALAMIPLLLQSDRPLIVTISFGDDGRFLGDVQYDVAKAAATRLSFALSRKLRREGVVAVTVYPGFTRTERVERGITQERLAETHTPRFVGRAVVALATDPNVMKRSGGAFKVGQLGLDYGFTDVDGRQPEPFYLPDEGDG